MFISSALAQEVGTAVATQPSMADAFWTNMGLIGLMFVLFYFLMIRPQQKRLKEQRAQLDSLKEGDKVVTGGGLYGVISKILSDDEVEVDLGGAKVVAMRYTIQTRLDETKDIPLPKVAEVKTAKAKTTPVKSAKKVTAKKTAAKKTTTKKTAGAKASKATKKTTATTKTKKTA